MDFLELIKNRRTIRRFKQIEIPDKILVEMIDAARKAPSAANLQPLEYIIITDEMIRNQIFPFIKWAGYIVPHWSPSTEERPIAYIAILVTNINNQFYQRDVGLASSHIIFIAENYSIGSCILCNIDKKQISSILAIPNYILLDSLIALGYKNEISIMEDNNSKIEYWRDEKKILHVPKKSLQSIVHLNKYTTEKKNFFSI